MGGVFDSLINICLQTHGFRNDAFNVQIRHLFQGIRQSDRNPDIKH